MTCTGSRSILTADVALLWPALPGTVDGHGCAFIGARGAPGKPRLSRGGHNSREGGTPADSPEPSARDTQFPATHSYRSP